MNIHMNRQTNEAHVEGEIPIDTMRRYISYCKT